ncbi:MAG TPA: hypothetical protein VFS09_09775 [Candidatus Eisenbacteria bacterium]|nr:hypothetical protein [Candidatus Eisenbacteria bacterium]
MSRHDEIDLASVRTISVLKRPTKVRVEQFAPTPDPASPIASFDQFLPDLLSGSQLRDLIQAWVLARTSGRPAVAMLGGHVIKTGVQRPLLSLVDAGAFTAIAMNGAAAIHDFEVALFGTTSEPVEETLVGGQFGMVEETPSLMNHAVREGVEKGLGMGEALGEFLLEADAPYASLSILAQAASRGLPVTVHVAIGTDTIHQHPTFDGATTGAATHRDFRIFAAALRELEDGVVLNFGSAVILPEVFLKALSTVRNLGHSASRFTAASFDQIRHYRPEKNILERPTRAGGKGYAFVGPHELWIPLLAALYLGRAPRLGP